MSTHDDSESKAPWLPDYPGPKLRPFTSTGTTADLEFVRDLANDTDNKHSFIWQVLIGKKAYALKMFKYNVRHEWSLPPPDGVNRFGLSRQDYECLLDPFYCECRAYGRLAEAGRTDLASPVHGYLYLTTAQDQELHSFYGQKFLYEHDINGQLRRKARGKGHDVKEKSEEGEYEEEEDDEDDEDLFNRYEYDYHPVRAIVKELVKDEDLDMFSMPLTADSFLEMFLNLAELHELGILVRDIHRRNYVLVRTTGPDNVSDTISGLGNGDTGGDSTSDVREAGKTPQAAAAVRRVLVDFSLAWTLPHPLLQNMGYSQYIRERTKDAIYLGSMKDEWNDSVLCGDSRGEILDYDDGTEDQKKLERITKYAFMKKEDLGKWPVFPFDDSMGT